VQLKLPVFDDWQRLAHAWAGGWLAAGSPTNEQSVTHKPRTEDTRVRRAKTTIRKEKGKEKAPACCWYLKPKVATDPQ
jgi:hypothetical protein